jgi:chromosomal replication initiator protein
LTERLKTRFLGGLLADIQVPNLETREAILRRKAEILGIDISEEVINYIASRIKSNIRSLEASLININHVANILQNKRITIEMAKTHLKPLFEENQNKQITITDILEKVAVKYETTPELIISKNRHNSIIMPRFIAIYLSTQLTNLTTIEIGKEFGKRDHSTVINARKNIESLLKEDDNIREIIEEIRSELKS